MTQLSLVWEVRQFNEFSICQLYEMLQLRVDVFVVEQQCAYPELDSYDQDENTKHLMGRDADSQLLAYARLLPPNLNSSKVGIGRIVVKKNARGLGIGHQLMHRALEESQKEWASYGIRIAAQDYLQKFYEYYGFVRQSDVFLDHGIPHIEMLKDA